jgi:hypothetical protein
MGLGIPRSTHSRVESDRLSIGYLGEDSRCNDLIRQSISVLGYILVNNMVSIPICSRKK